MRGYRLRIALLSLGVLLGYGSAAKHYLRGEHHSRHCPERAGRDFGRGADYDRGRGDHGQAAPEKL